MSNQPNKNSSPSTDEITEDNQNPPNHLPVSEGELEGRTHENDLHVWVNGVKARMYINDSGNYSSPKVWILFEEKHEWFNDHLFATKYYEFPKPGVLNWGKDEMTQWTIKHRDNEFDSMVDPPKKYWSP